MRGDAKKERKKDMQKERERAAERKKKGRKREWQEEQGKISLLCGHLSGAVCCPRGITASLRVSDPGGSQRKHSGISSICYRSHRSVLWVVAVNYTEIGTQAVRTAEAILVSGSLPHLVKQFDTVN